ncbi:hypothetical protein PE36_00195 [Moritella sp. PE36]|uniref:DEAD/DEAH box helicase n=1 Tax=Moritella sp. PE36 TaxID=58051 RepID=UPI0001569288|nr:DEAD/DEAH box helicase [Moritella sp. PE36]EDM66170.1 hypothetical protein PE36_00195 [Moritella sp. PE36]
MKLRRYQEEMVEKSLDALLKYQGVACVAATGAGKTCVLSYIAAQFNRVLILQHLDELKQQNAETFGWVNPKLDYGFIDPDNNDFNKPYAFGMMQTVVHRLDDMTHYDLIIIDECHRLGAISYEKIIERARVINPDVKVFGTSATIERRDQKSLSKYLDVVAHQVQLDDLIRQGYLVPPRAFVIKVDGVEAAANAKDDEQVEAVLNTDVTNQRIVNEWKERASTRLTVAFCQTVNHAKDVAQAFNDNGIAATHVSGVMKPRERKKRLKAFERGEYQVLTNATLLTEGWNCPPVSCLLILRGSSSKGALIQMAGRVLRKVNPSDYPNVIKHDALILDFGVSLIRHGNLNAGDRLTFDKHDYDAEIDAALQCPCCGGAIEPKDKQCPQCLYMIEKDKNGKIIDNGKDKITNFTMTEKEIFALARFYYEPFRHGQILVSHGWDAWVLVYNMKGVFYTVGAKKKCKHKLLGCTQNKVEALATADDFVSQYGQPDLAGKQRKWLQEQASEAQLLRLPEKYQFTRMSKHQASCLMVLTNESRWDKICEEIESHYEKVGRFNA